MNRSTKFFFMVLGTAGAALLAANMLEAKASWMKKVKEAGLDGQIKDCTYCHTAKGKKDLNDAGKWMVAKKEELKAADYDMAWMKDYKPAEKK